MTDPRQKWFTVTTSDPMFGILCCYCAHSLKNGDRYYKIEGTVVAHARCKGAEDIRKCQEWWAEQRKRFEERDPDAL